MPGSEYPPLFVSKNAASNLVVNRLRMSWHIRFDGNNGYSLRQNKARFSMAIRRCSESRTVAEFFSHAVASVTVATSVCLRFSADVSGMLRLPLFRRIFSMGTMHVNPGSASNS